MYNYDKCRSINLEYARAYILPQKFQNLFSLEESFKKGTIFKDLYRPYYNNNDFEC